MCFFKIKILSVLTLAFSLLIGCSEQDVYSIRANTVESDTQFLNIAVAWPLDVDNRGIKLTIINGINLAVKEINTSGGVLGRQIKIKTFNDERSITTGLRLAQEIAEDKSLYAVIGHLDSYISVPTSTTYEFSGLITLNPGSTDARLTNPAYPHLFRLIPKNDVQGQKLAQYLKVKGLSRVLIYYINNPYGLALANSFEREAIDLGLKIEDRRAYYKSNRDHFRIMQDWKRYLDFDAIFIAGSMPEGVDIIQAVKKAGITQPIYTGAGLDSLNLLKNTTNFDNVHVVSFFPQNYHHSDNFSTGLLKDNTTKFVDAYKKEFNVNPTEASSALGYDAIHLLAESIKKAGNLNRDIVVNKIRNNDGWQGVTGKYDFDHKGDVDEKLLVLNKVVNGKFVFVAQIN